MENYTESFDLERLIGEMMHEIILLKAQNLVIKAIAKKAMTEASARISPSQVDDSYHQSLAVALDEIKSSHPWFDGYWKDTLRDILPGTD